MEAKVGMFWEYDTSVGAIWKTAFSVGSLVVKEMFLPYRSGPFRNYNAYSGFPVLEIISAMLE